MALTLAWRSGLVGLALSASPGGIDFGPEPGTTLTRNWSERLVLEVDSLDESLDGSPVSLPLGLIELEQGRSLELQDELLESADGRPTDLRRSVRDSSQTLALELDSQPVGRVEGESRCVGSVVRFAFDPEQPGYERERVAGDLDDELLERLDPDLDLLGLLPEGEVEAGATWEPEPQALRSLFAAGGDVGFHPTEAVIEMSGAPPEILLAGALVSLHELFAPGSELAGRVAGKYVGDEQDADGGALARLEFELEVEAGSDLGPRFRSLFHESTSATHRLELSGELEGRLVLLWDLDARHLRSARFEGDVALAGHVLFPVDGPGERGPVEFAGDYELSGLAAVELVVE